MFAKESLKYYKNKMLIEDKICASSVQSAVQVKTGIDIISIQEIKDLVDAPIGVWLTEREWKDALALGNENHRLQRLAGKFACKEAIIKVLEAGMSQIELVDIEILHDVSGKPIVFLHETALQFWQQISASHLDVSISHDNNFAMAIAIAICLKN
ncbi:MULTISPECIES: holo-ACP synthase [Nostoc]|uniref:Holo-[acyl-carrier-protein] synthase n=1 Tax=Nostoc paludosum FACHB-159 TaxID=2692908 RepID=A0ABR8K4U7_9NOSO|nr:MULTISPECIES: holo-ACP synthase [Nostoc]MBD2678206.1 holo-ACP synthase [Nostoc sp. FACHB-857]MBD2734466.1 holo-ACP synthase [Nostoc paludosum FACHB-159]